MPAFETVLAVRRQLSLHSALRWLTLVAAATALLWWLRPALDRSHMAMAYLLIVLLGSARHGNRLGIALAFLCFLCFNFFLLPPYYTFQLADQRDWIVLVTFVVTGTVAAQLLERAQRQTMAAQQRAEEIDRLSALGAETLNAARAEDAAQAIARVFRSTLNVAQCEIHLWDLETLSARRIARAAHESAGGEPDSVRTDELLRYVVEQNVMAIGRTDGTTHLSPVGELAIDDALATQSDARVILIPLRVPGRTVGVLRLADHATITLDRSQARLAAVLCYYAALGAERVRLLAEAERAAALRHASEIKDSLLASVSHDLRTPLTTIKALAHELSQLGDERALAIEEEADRLNRFVSDLLDLSRLNAGMLRTGAEIVAAEDVIGAVLQRVAGAQGEREINVALPATDSIAVGRLDFTHTLRILVNLLENALKYGLPGQPIDLLVRQDDGWLTFDVMDRGSGVAPQDAERIFLPFHRTSGATADAGGAGLGLAIARGLAEAQGGSLTYRPRPGGGSVFSLRVPAAAIADLSVIS